MNGYFSGIYKQDIDFVPYVYLSHLLNWLQHPGIDSICLVDENELQYSDDFTEYYISSKCIMNSNLITVTT